MKRKTVKRLAVAIVFVAFWLAVIFVLECLLVPKYQSGIVEGSMIAEYYKDKTKHDVIMVGDCEVYENISTVELWNKYGITSYIRGSAQQLVWQSYYLLEDALRYETPDVVVFNVLSLKYNTPQNEAYNRMSLDGMRWSGSKVNAVRASMTEDEKFADYLFPLLRYHSRWSELEEDDFRHIFSKDPVTQNGYYMRVDVRPEDEFPDPITLADYTLGENAMSYLDKMTELCRSKGIKLVLVKAPILYPHWYDEWDEQIVDYAGKNGLSYINFIPLRDEIGLDMSTDTYDAGLHLNVNGAEKMADYFGQWLVENCGVKDHRFDPAYAEYYGKLSENYQNEKNSQLRELAEYGKIVSRVPNAEVKETNVLKNLIILALIAALCLGLIACSTTSDGKSDSNDKTKVIDNASKDSDKTPDAEKGFTLTYKGAEIVIGDNMAPLLEKLGEPTKYFESESCAYQGLDKVYTYGSVVIYTCPDKENDYVLSFEIKDDTLPTTEGVYIGDSKDKVAQVYGDPSSTTDSSVSYVKGNVTLSFIFTNDTISTITYAKVEQR